DTLIKYIDRVRMSAIRTADRLQRTSVGLENLEGGLAVLKKVGVEEMLVMAQDLEGELTRNIANYQWEWKTTMEYPQKLKRFSHFINSAARDDNLAYVIERDQPRPATSEERALKIPLIELVEN